MPATQAQLKVIRRFVAAGALAGALYVLGPIAFGFLRHPQADVPMTVLVLLMLPVYLLPPVGIGAIAGCLVGWAFCLVSRIK